jgi:hypothetical protein
VIQESDEEEPTLSTSSSNANRQPIEQNESVTQTSAVAESLTRPYSVSQDLTSTVLFPSDNVLLGNHTE